MNALRSIVYILLILMTLLLVFTIPGEKGLIRAYRLHQELIDLKAQNASLQNTNYNLAQEALLLKENLAYIEHVIIQEMNLVRPGDIIVVFKKKNK